MIGAAICGGNLHICFIFTFRAFSRRFCPKQLTVIQAYIHTLMAVVAMQGADQQIRSSLRFSILPKDTSTCKSGELNQWPSDSTGSTPNHSHPIMFHYVDCWPKECTLLHECNLTEKRGVNEEREPESLVGTQSEFTWIQTHRHTNPQRYCIKTNGIVQ